MPSETLLTPETHPDHDTVGLLWVGYTGAIYFCDSYEPRLGFWMTNVRNPQDRRNVSERAPHRTYHRIHGVVKRHEAQAEHGTYYLLDLCAREPQAVAVDWEQARNAPATHAVLFDEHYARQAVLRVQDATKLLV